MTTFPRGLALSLAGALAACNGGGALSGDGGFIGPQDGATTSDARSIDGGPMLDAPQLSIDAAIDAPPDAPPDAPGPPCIVPTCGATCGSLCDLAIACTTDADCTTNACDSLSHTCVADPCHDHHRDGREADVDCGDGVCAACAAGSKCTADVECAPGGCDAITHLCVANPCHDHHRDNTETDVDCGGFDDITCPACQLGQHCTSNNDVDSGWDCVGGVVTGHDCTNGVVDGTETDVDCGGSGCLGCALGETCAIDSDCASHVCDGAIRECVPSGCSDGRIDGAETSLDCGGGCLPCGLGVHCASDADCASNACDAVTHACVANTCNDHRLDGGETDVDCGGGCAPCPLFHACAGNSDCASGACDTTAGECVPAGCANGVQDGNESAIDCGGECAPCPLTAACRIDQDCLSTACDGISFTCVASQCVDHHIEIGESDIDCGFASCNRCAFGQTCVYGQDCVSNACDASGMCQLPWCQDGVQDQGETDVDCGGGSCAGCPLGEHCDLDYDCTSFACDVATFTCVADHCFDHREDADETDTDCGGPTCAARCPSGDYCKSVADCIPGDTCSVGIYMICQ